MKTVILALILAVMAFSPLTAQGTGPGLIYDNFSNAPTGYNNGIPGFSVSQSGSDNIGYQTFAATDGSVNYFFTGGGLSVPTDGTNVIGGYMFPAGNGLDTETFTSTANLTFAPDTDYKFSILASTGNASHSPSVFLDIDDISIDTPVATTLVGTPTQNAFSLYTVSFNTATNPIFNGDSLAIDFGFTNGIATNNQQLDVKFTDAQLVPEPSTYALLLAGVAALFALRRGMVKA